MNRLVALLSILLVISGCSSFLKQTQPAGEDSAEKPVSIGFKTEFKLLPPAQGPAPVLLKQIVTMEARGDQNRFIGVVRINKERVQMVGLLPTGQQLFSLDYGGKTLTQEDSSYADIPGQEVLTIMQFALWPESSIRQHYPENSGWDADFSPAQRTLEKDGQELLNVNYFADELVIKNYLGHYRILIKTLEKTEL
ncbi:MAG: DUF3261 domain-containing protein [Proteobacteria bacterium]|nr:DUF3261 domain-containing protein [Pseudomonadota bacterium]